MRRNIIAAAALFILTVGFAAAASCSQGAPPGAPAKAEGGSFNPLPHPAFAHAGAHTGSPPSIADVAARVVPAVVNISSTRVVEDEGPSPQSPFESDPFFRQFFGEGPQGMPREQRARSLGSGVIVSPDGIVLTNNHVVERASEIRVTLSDERELRAALLGSDPKSDVAVLKLQGDVGALTALPWGDSDRLRMGDVVLAVGNPFGVGQTVTMGIVSATGRANMGILDYEDFIQTDAAINPGNSGGPLVDMEGHLVGITTAMLSATGGNQGVGFAIPSSMARPIMDSLLKTGKVRRGFLGVAIQDLTPDLARALGIDASRGVLVSGVTGGSPAARAGLARGDVVVGLDGHKIESSSRLRNLIASTGVGTRVSLDVLRGGKKVSLSATLGEAPRSAQSATAPTESQGPLAGVSVADLDRAARERYGVGSDVRQGVVVTQVPPGSPADEAGLRPGDVIVEVDRKRVDSASQFSGLSQGSSGRVLLLVQRGEATEYLVVRK